MHSSTAREYAREPRKTRTRRISGPVYRPATRRARREARSHARPRVAATAAPSASVGGPSGGGATRHAPRAGSPRSHRPRSHLVRRSRAASGSFRHAERREVFKRRGGHPLGPSERHPPAASGFQDKWRNSRRRVPGIDPRSAMDRRPEPRCVSAVPAAGIVRPSSERKGRSWASSHSSSSVCSLA